MILRILGNCGTVLGPLLFSIYVNDLYDSTSGEEVSIAEDTAVFFIVKTWENLKNKVENYFSNISFFHIQL